MQVLISSKLIGSLSRVKRAITYEASLLIWLCYCQHLRRERQRPYNFASGKEAYYPDFWHRLQSFHDEKTDCRNYDLVCLKFWKDLNFARVLFYYSYVRFLFFIKHDFSGINHF